MKKAKRALALALVFALVASFCVTGAAAEPGQGDIVYGSYDGNVWSQTADGDGSYTDERSGVTVSKTAEAVSGEDNQYEVTLKVEVPVTTSTKSASAATVLVIDVSNSMYYCDKCGANIWHKDDCGYNEHGSRYDDVEDSQTRLYAAKKAAKDFVDGYSDTENDTPRYVAIVIFGRYGYNVGQYWYDVSTDNGYEDAIDAIDGLNTPGDDIGGTNLDEGLSKAEELFTRSNYYGIIDDVPRKNRFAIALTDGRPTCSELRGDGTSCNQNILNDTQETADALKKEAKLYTVCFGAADEVCWEGSWYQEKGPTVGDFLENSIASSGCAYEASDGAALSNIFNQLTDEIKDSLKNLTVTDPMAKGVTLDTNFGNDNSVSVENDDTITWRLNNGEKNGDTITYTLSYTVTVDPDDFKDQKAGYYPLNGETYLSIPAQNEGDTESTVQFPVPGVYVTPTVTENTNEITIQVYVDGTKVSITEENFDRYISGLQNGENTENWQQSYNDDGNIVGAYSYENYDSADIVLTPNGNYVLQGIEGTFIQGETAWTGITPSGAGWKIDNVMGETTLKVYLNTKYSVEYVVTGSETIDAPTDDAVYVTGAGVTSENMANVDNNDGAPRSWKNNGLTTKFTIANVPEGATGWTDEANDSQTAGTEITVSNAVAAGLNGDDNTFTFTATANQYKVTYHANNGASPEATYEVSGITHGTNHTVLGNTNDYFQYTNTGYTFAGWATSEDGEVIYEAGEEIANITENVNLYAKWTAITGTLTVTKTVEGLEGNDTLPDNFSITVTGPGDYKKELTLSNADEGTTYTWTIGDLSLGTYTVTEDNYAVEGYLCNGANGSATLAVNGEGPVTATVALTNSYTLISRELSVVKTVIKVGETDVEEGAAIPAAKVGETIIYKIVVTNNSNVALTNISVTDTLGESELTLHTDAACTETASTTISSLAAYGQEGDSETFYAKYEVTADDAKAGSVKNTATASDGDTTGEGDITVDVKKQYKLIVKYYYDSAETGNEFMPSGVTTTEYTLNEGDGWIVSTEDDATHVALETVEDDEGIQFVLDTVLPITSAEGGIQKDEVVNLVYARDEWEDGTPDYKQAWIVYEVADDSTGMGSVSPESRVVTLTDVADGIYKGTVTAASTATPEDGSVFVEWSWTHDEDGPSTNATLSHEFTAEGGETYTYTASFKTGTTDAEVTKTLVSYTRDGVTVDEIPEGFKARVGDVLNYKITIKNTGEIALEDVTVSDTLWGNGVASAMVGETDTDVSGGSCTVNVASGSSVTITYSYTVQADDIGQTITNTATVDLPNVDPEDDPKDEEEVTVDEYGITVTPADITIYMGGDDGYEAVVGANGQVISDNDSLPTPLFTVELSESFGELSVEQIEAIEIAGTTSDAGTRGWRFDYAGETEDGTDLYYIVPDAGQEPIRVTYTDGEGIAAVSDHFDPTAIDELFAEFAIELYTGTVTSVTAEVNGITCEIDYSGKGKLTVRAVDDTDENPVVGVQEALPRPVEAGEGAVTAPAGTTYTLNETTVAADAAGVGLLFDGIIDDGADRTGALLAELESELGVTVEDGNYQAQYLDLVDAHNGNAWVKASGEVTVYWGYPEGTGEDTDFALYHFEGLHREGENSGFDIEDVATSDIERVQITKTANGIAFDIGSGGFSPFVLVWDGDEGGDKPWWPPIGPGDDDDDGDDDVDREFVPKWLNIDDHYAYIIGYEDGTVRPQGNITRAEVATIFFRLLTDEVREEYWSTVSGYTDVKAGDWYNNAISTLSNLGVITGYEDGTFRPNASISRAEFVTIATRFFDYTAEYEGTFSDVSYSSWYADFVQAAVDMGLVNGYENGTFRPNASITRAEAVAIVNRVLLRRPDADHLLPWSVMNTFSDNVLESAWYYEDIQEATNSHDYEWLKSGVEDWTEKLPERDWAALEREWSSAYDAPGGEVTG